MLKILLTKLNKSCSLIKYCLVPLKTPRRQHIMPVVSFCDPDKK